MASFFRGFSGSMEDAIRTVASALVMDAYPPGMHREQFQPLAVMSS